MAQGNIVQGMAHGALGDMVLSRLNGVQVSRVRNRTPRNPRTAKQLYQRAIMATVMRAYTAGAEIFDHSFERYIRGAECQHRFFERNCAQLRSLLAADLQSSLSAGAMRTFFGAPKVNSPTPSPYIISEGSLPDGWIYTGEYYGMGYGQIEQNPQFSKYNNSDGRFSYAQIATMLINDGILSADDIMTICFFAEDFTSLPEFEVRDYTAECSKQYPGGFGYVRLAFNTNVFDNSTIAPLTPVIVGDGTNGAQGGFFYVTGWSGYNAATAAQNIVGFSGYRGYSLNDLLQPSGWSVETFGGYMGVIRSRKDTRLRSNAKMIYSAKRNNVFSPFGICSYYVLKAWQQATETVGVSDAILESDSFIRA